MNVLQDDKKSPKQLVVVPDFLILNLYYFFMLGL